MFTRGQHYSTGTLHVLCSSASVVKKTDVAKEG